MQVYDVYLQILINSDFTAPPVPPYTSVPFTLFYLVSCSSGRLYTSTYTHAMVPNHNLQIHNVYTLGSPPPTLACPYCPQHFKTKIGCTRHIQAKHPADGSEPHAPDTAAQSIPSSLQLSFHDSSPIPSHIMPSLPPSCDRFNANSNLDMDIEHPHSDQGYILSECGEEVNENFPSGGNPNVRNQHVPDASRITHAFHPKLDGMSIVCYIYININFALCRADL